MRVGCTGGSYGWVYGSEALYFQKGGEEAKVAGAVISGAASGVGVAAGAAGTTAAGLFTTAGALATVPVAGWIAGAAVAVAATAVALVGAIKSRKIKNADAVKVAKAMGLPDASGTPNFVRKALRWDEFKIRRKLRPLERKYARFQRKGKLSTRRGQRAKAKLALMQAILTVQQQNRATDLAERKYAEHGRTLKADALKRLQATAANAAAGRAVVPAPAPSIPVVPLMLLGGAGIMLLVIATKSRRAT